MLLKAAPNLIKKIKELTSSPTEKIDNSEFGRIRTAALFLNKKNTTAVNLHRNELETNNELFTLYQNFDYALTTFNSLKSFFENEPKCKESDLDQYNKSKSEYRKISKEMNEIIQKYGKYHDFIKYSLALCAPPLEMTHVDVKRIRRGF